MFQNATANSNMMLQQFAQFQHRQFQMPFVQPQPIRPVPMPTFPGFQYQNPMLMGMQRPPPDPQQMQLPLSQRAPGPVSRRSHSQDQPSCSRDSQSIVLGYERRMGRPQKTFRQKYEQYLPNSQNSRNDADQPCSSTQAAARDLQRQQMQIQQQEPELHLRLNIEPEMPKSLFCRWNDCEAGPFETEAKLHQHVVDTHLKYRPDRDWTCRWRECPREMEPFAAHYQLDTHCLTHTGFKPFVCKEPGCGKKYSRLENFKTHQRTHTGEKPYSCPICPKTFTNPSDKAKHVSRTHSDEKKCICLDESCRKKYTDPSSLRKHILTQHGPNELDRQRKVKKEMQPTRRGGGVRKGKQSTSPQISPSALQQWLVERASQQSSSRPSSEEIDVEEDDDDDAFSPANTSTTNSSPSALSDHQIQPNSSDSGVSGISPMAPQSSGSMSASSPNSSIESVGSSASNAAQSSEPTNHQSSEGKKDFSIDRILRMAMFASRFVDEPAIERAVRLVTDAMQRSSVPARQSELFVRSFRQQISRMQQSVVEEVQEGIEVSHDEHGMIVLTSRQSHRNNEHEFDWADEVHSYIQMPFITIPETIMTSIQEFESRLDVGQREFEEIITTLEDFFRVNDDIERYIKIEAASPSNSFTPALNFQSFSTEIPQSRQPVDASVTSEAVEEKCPFLSLPLHCIRNMPQQTELNQTKRQEDSEAQAQSSRENQSQIQFSQFLQLQNEEDQQRMSAWDRVLVPDRSNLTRSHIIQAPPPQRRYPTAGPDDLLDPVTIEV
ncbi:hypothetical protein WR25_22762 [Diploscapter pachys]|uniref:C2H2-type domain-containing protein n=1 Tax=Diploscapter pachys TaxID=2018661 RepID=A0A2A2KPH9_9BILA|nr:hypothetical protein WR25_22762 [Diploscapter pachys]